jgi:hypothetical protein
MSVVDLIRAIGSVEKLRATAETIATFRPKVNSHVHLPPNFSAFTTVDQVLALAVTQNVRVIGVTNYYDYQVYAKFAELSKKCRVFPIFGLEIISLIENLVKDKVKINDPGNPGRMYICGKGVTRFEPVPAEAAAILEKIKASDFLRMQAMVEKVSAIFRAAKCDLGVTEPSIKKMIAKRHGCQEDIVYLQERHIAQAFQEALFSKIPAFQRLEVLEKIYGIPAKASMEDAVQVQNEFRSNLLKAGKQAFIVEGFVDDVEAKKMILGMGGIPCYPTLADGASPLCPYEATPETLIANIRGMGIPMAEFIPIRNSPEVLEKYVLAMRAAGLVVVGGTEHNTLELIPLDPACLKGVPVPEVVKAIFWEGACVIAAHQFLMAHGQSGFMDETGKLAGNFASDDARIKAFATLGAAVIQTDLEVA